MSNIEEYIEEIKTFAEYSQEVLNDMEYEKPVDVTITQKEVNAINNLLSEREQDKARIKELEEDLYSANKIVEEYIDSIPKQKVKGIVKQIQEEYNKLEEQFDCIWDKKSKDNYDRYKLQELSAMQQELGFILGKFEELLEEGE